MMEEQERMGKSLREGGIEYQIRPAETQCRSKAAIVMRALAWCTWIGGFFASCGLASNKGEAGFMFFLVGVLAFGIGGAVWFCFAEPFEHLASIAAALRCLNVKKAK